MKERLYNPKTLEPQPFVTEAVAHEVESINKVDFPEVAELVKNAEIPLFFRMYKVVPRDKSFGITVDGEETHFRTGKIRNTFVTDRNGLRWIISAKGMGLLDSHSEDMLDLNYDDLTVRHWHRETSDGKRDPKVWGLNDMASIRHAEKYYEIFEKLGIRVTKFIASARLKSLIIGDTTVPVQNIPRISAEEDEAFMRSPPSSRREIPLTHSLPENFDPGIEIDAFRIKTRLDQIHEATQMKDSSYIRTNVEKAITLISEEPGMSNMSVEEYLNWFVKKIGEDLGTMHGAGHVHGSLHSNITLDCRITDLDSPMTLDEICAEDRKNPAKRIEYRDFIFEEASNYDAMQGDVWSLIDIITFIKEVRAAFSLPELSDATIARDFANAYARSYSTQRGEDLRVPAHIRLPGKEELFEGI